MATLTASGISSLAVELLYRSLVLPRTVARVPGTEFRGPNGSTITVRVRQPRTAKTQGTPGATISFDPLNETPVDLTVNHLYDAVHVTDEDLTLGIEDFGRQVLAPMLGAVAIGAENQVAAVMNGLTATVTGVTADTVDQDVLSARETLGTNDVPTGNRYLAVSPGFATLLLGSDLLSDASSAGTASALRDAVVGSYRGFTVVESNGLDAGTAVAYHESALVWGNRAPAVPDGAADAAVSNQQGVALRTLRDFDTNTLQDAVAISTFAGSNTVETSRLVKLSNGGTT